MPTIRILPDRVANQIAAGEVVERPAAVVKELVENSIDAGATQIEVEYRNGGKAYIRVEDNGKGMNPDEALLCLERHATSKIREADDLLLVTSFGFRGEALPSIASVSRFTLRTRSKGEEAGREIFLNGGKMIHNKDCGMPEGTRIEVAQLFNSVPARRKFLKTDATESAHICHLARLYALAHPEISFTLLEAGRTIFRSPTCSDLKDRVHEIFGRGLAEDMEPVEGEGDGYRLDGLLAKPGKGRSTRKEMLFFVNRRPVESKTLAYSLIEAYHSYVPKGRYPPVALFLEIDPGAVDVNVHPAKRELRFREEGKVRGYVIRTVLDRLRELSGDVRIQGISPVDNSDEKEFVLPRLDTSALPVPRFNESGADSTDASITMGEVSSTGESPVTDAGPLPEEKSEVEEVLKRVGFRDDPGVAWRFLGRVQGDLVLFSTDAGVIALHCRAAYERVRLEQVEDALALGNSVESQTLLIPEPIEVDGVEAGILESALPELSNQGFAIEEFGRNFYRVEACPSWIEPGESISFLRDFLDLARRAGGSDAGSIAQEEIARLAVVRGRAAGDDFADGEVIRLAEQLLRCRNPLTCPQGRPTYFEHPWREWKKRFGRGL
ncbi:MAG: DNA mismatch repair protein MutL [Opitutae bacterium]|nr:DNA mismatch repair protein MutL [Opitutae bacterium]